MRPVYRRVWLPPSRGLGDDASRLTQWTALPLVFVVLHSVAGADERADVPNDAKSVAVENRINVRGGLASSNHNGRPTICVDVRLASEVGLETCGTGAGLFGDVDGADMAHFRGSYAFLRIGIDDATTLRVRGSAGFAELQVGVDRPGFTFRGPDAARGAVSGPEMSLSAQLLAPIYNGFDFVFTGTAGLAWFRRADELVVPQQDLQPFVSLEAGIGW